MEFVIGGMAAVGAGFFTNPLEVLKTRMQLQGELRAKGKHAVHYRNVFHAAYMVAKHDGILALQNGLTPALLVQLILNGIRLGTYQCLDNQGFMVDEKGNRIFYRSALAAGLSGAFGQFLCNPLFIVKTQQQSHTSSVIAVGYQHQKAGLIKSIIRIFREHGVKGLFRNVSAGFPRAFVGCSAQLTSFEYAKNYLKTIDALQHTPLLAISVMMTPFDLVLTRLYNQPIDKDGRGKIYQSYFDCIRKIYKAEGPSAFYKGIGPMYLRLGPHSVLCLVFWDELKVLHAKYWPN